MKEIKSTLIYWIVMVIVVIVTLKYGSKWAYKYHYEDKVIKTLEENIKENCFIKKGE